MFVPPHNRPCGTWSQPIIKKEYSGVRFDWNGFITQVTLDGKHTFCVPEALEPGRGTGGCGLCGEFGIHDPLGYDETPIGEYFPKIGAGLLKRPDSEPYDFFRKYEAVPNNSDITTTKTNTSGAGEKENNNFTVHKFALWGYKHVVSPETFVKIDLEPGTVQTWSREYEFFKKIPKGW